MPVALRPDHSLISPFFCVLLHCGTLGASPPFVSGLNLWSLDLTLFVALHCRICALRHGIRQVAVVPGRGAVVFVGLARGSVGSEAAGGPGCPWQDLPVRA